MVKLPEPPDPLLAKAETTTLGTGTPALNQVLNRFRGHHDYCDSIRGKKPTTHE
jgi:hypothetical protein